MLQNSGCFNVNKNKFVMMIARGGKTQLRYSQNSVTYLYTIYVLSPYDIIQTTLKHQIHISMNAVVVTLGQSILLTGIKSLINASIKIYMNR